MVNPSIQEQFDTVSNLLPKKEALKNPLKLHQRILQIQLKIDKVLKGSTLPWDDKKGLSDLQKKSNKTKKPIAYFLDPSIFMLKILSQEVEAIIKVFAKQENVDFEQRRVLDYFAEKENLTEILEATLNEDISTIEKAAEELDVKPVFLIYITSTLIQPFLQDLARKIDSSQLDGWWQPTCPVCGRQPVIAKIKERKRYLACTFCGTEYLSDQFVCVNCGNKNPYRLKYLAIDANPAFQIDFCDKCRHYLKVIDEHKLKEPIPKGLEDVLTIDLDLVAERAKLTRDKPR